jgi:hypothetical protein
VRPGPAAAPVTSTGGPWTRSRATANSVWGHVPSSGSRLSTRDGTAHPAPIKVTRHPGTGPPRDRGAYRGSGDVGRNFWARLPVSTSVV